jgi:ubiquinone/menaquinone biosynthesis C-methylase UbiE
MKILSIGAGNQKRVENLTTLDIAEETNPDIVWNLNDFPYPIEDNSFDLIECYDVIEHVENIPKVMEECHRILKAGGKINLTTPHYSCNNSYIDPTHRFHLSYFSFDCFDSSHTYSYYSKARFKIVERQILFEGSRIYKSIMCRIVRLSPHFYEKKLAWIFPAWFLSFSLQADK